MMAGDMRVSGSTTLLDWGPFFQYWLEVGNRTACGSICSTWTSPGGQPHLKLQLEVLADAHELQHAGLVVEGIRSGHRLYWHALDVLGCLHDVSASIHEDAGPTDLHSRQYQFSTQQNFCLHLWDSLAAASWRELMSACHTH